MPFPLESEILVAISEPSALDRVCEALRRERLPFVRVRRLDLTDRPSRSVALVIYDLSPFDWTALDLLEGVRRRYPTVPILLYPPPHPEAARLLLECARLRLVHGLLQSSSPNDAERLRGAVHRACLESPAVQTLRAMDQMLGESVHVKIKLFIAEVIRRVGPQEQPPPSVEALARGLNMSRRSLERLWWGTGLPGPKQMIDWATLLTLVGAARAIGAAASTLASRRGIDARRLHRLRRRLFGPKWPTLPKRPDEEFNLLLMKFGTACRNRRIRWRAQSEQSVMRRAKSRSRRPVVRYVSASS